MSNLAKQVLETGRKKKRRPVHELTNTAERNTDANKLIDMYIYGCTFLYVPTHTVVLNNLRRHICTDCQSVPRSQIVSCILVYKRTVIPWLLRFLLFSPGDLISNCHCHYLLYISFTLEWTRQWGHFKRVLSSPSRTYIWTDFDHRFFFVFIYMFVLNV